jgi:hypothetical protein
MLDKKHRGRELLLNCADERPEGLRLALRESRGRFVEAQHFGLKREQARELDDSASSSRQVADVGDRGKLAL